MISFLSPGGTEPYALFTPGIRGLAEWDKNLVEGLILQFGSDADGTAKEARA
jgi:hypothetical protein